MTTNQHPDDELHHAEASLEDMEDAELNDIVCKIKSGTIHVNPGDAPFHQLVLGEFARRTNARTNTQIEAHGVKGMNSTPWRKTFKSIDAMNTWVEKHDAEVYAATYWRA